MMQTLEQVDSKTTDTLIANNAWQQLVAIVAHQHPADIADWFDNLPTEAITAVFNQLDMHTAAEVLDEVHPQTRRTLTSGLDEAQLAAILNELPMDDAAIILDELSSEKADRLLRLMHPDEAAEAQRLLSYPEKTAGRLMRTDMALLHQGWTAAEATTQLRSQKEVANLYNLYVVDEENHLVGRVRSRTLLLADGNTAVADIMQPVSASVTPDTDQEVVADLIAHYDVVSIPVVENGGHLLGIVTVDDVLDVVKQEATEDMQRFGGSQPLEEPYFATPAYTVFKKRVSWLFLLFFAGTLTGFVTQFYQDMWLQYAALATFVPLLIGTGGNSGSQTTATIVRALSVQEVDFTNLWQAWRKEVSVAVLLGLAMLAMSVLMALFVWEVEWGVALSVALALPIIIIWSVSLGTLVPITAEKVGIDPTAVSGPMISTIVDVTGLIIYYTLAGFILGI